MWLRRRCYVVAYMPVTVSILARLTCFDLTLSLSTMYVLEHIELPAKLLEYSLRSNKSNINQCCVDVRGCADIGISLATLTRYHLTLSFSTAVWLSNTMFDMTHWLVMILLGQVDSLWSYSHDCFLLTCLSSATLSSSTLITHLLQSRVKYFVIFHFNHPDLHWGCTLLEQTVEESFQQSYKTIP